MSDDQSKQIEQAEGRFSTGPMKALQILQTLFLLAIIGMCGYIWSTTIDSSNRIAALTQKIDGMSTEQARQGAAISKLTDEHYMLDRRVTTIEARGRP